MKKVGKLIGKAAHRYLGVDPETGRIIGESSQRSDFSHRNILRGDSF